MAARAQLGQESFRLRIPAEDRRLLDHAAKIGGLDVGVFIVRAATNAAKEVIARGPISSPRKPSPIRNSAR